MLCSCGEVVILTLIESINIFKRTLSSPIGRDFDRRHELSAYHFSGDLSARRGLTGLQRSSQTLSFCIRSFSKGIFGTEKDYCSISDATACCGFLSMRAPGNSVLPSVVIRLWLYGSSGKQRSPWIPCQSHITSHDKTCSANDNMSSN